MAVSRRLRFEILRRDGHACRYCGMKAPDVALTVDHVIPVALGGGDEPNNLVAACTDCNNGKSSVPADAPIVADVDAAALLWAKAIERATEIRLHHLAQIDDAIQDFDDYWRAWKCGDGKEVPRPADWPDSVARFMAADLSASDLERFVDVTMRRRPSIAAEQAWRFFCGCCWNEIGDRQELARRLIEDGSV